MNFRNSLTIERPSNLQANIVPGVFNGWIKAGCLDSGWAGDFHLLLSHLEPRSMGARHQDNCASRHAALATSWRAEQVTLLATASAPHALLLRLAGGWLPGGLAQRLPPGPITMTAHLAFPPSLCGGTPVLTLVSGSPFPSE